VLDLVVVENKLAPRVQQALLTVQAKAALGFCQLVSELLIGGGVDFEAPPGGGSLGCGTPIFVGIVAAVLAEERRFGW
jgi:hypothetical protein